jgi:hypothetical protein
MPTNPLYIYALQNDVEKVETIGLPTITTIEDVPVRHLNRGVFVRWGKSMIPGELHADFKYVINSSKAIRLNTQKRVAHQIMSRVVRTPRLFDRMIPRGVYAVVRPMAHEEGSGFVIAKGPMQVPPNRYGTEFVESDAEARIWFARTATRAGRSLLAYRVPMKDQHEGRFTCRASFGYEDFRRPPRHLSDLVFNAAAVIGLDFGAADVLITGNKGCLLELNSAPSVDFRHIREFYRESLPETIEWKYPQLKLDLEPND